MKVSELPLG